MLHVIIKSGVIYTSEHLYNYKYIWCGSIYVSMYAVDDTFGDCGYLDTSKVRINIILLFFFFIMLLQCFSRTSSMYILFQHNVL